MKCNKCEITLYGKAGMNNRCDFLVQPLLQVFSVSVRNPKHVYHYCQLIWEILRLEHSYLDCIGK